MNYNQYSIRMNDFDNKNSNTSETDKISINELIWAKKDGDPWWPGIILEVRKAQRNQPIEWKVAFLGERQSYQYLSRQKIKKWLEISPIQKKGKKLKSKNSLMSAIAFGQLIHVNKLDYGNHEQYIDCLEKNMVEFGEQGVIQFEKYLHSGKTLETIKEKINKQNDTKAKIRNKLSAISNEMEVIKKNMNIILTKIPPGQLLKLNSQVDFSNSSRLCESSSIDSKMALLNYLECLCQMFKIPYEANQTIPVLILGP